MKLEVDMFIRTTGDAYEPSKIGKIKEVDIVSFKEICYRIDSYNKHILIPESFIKKSSFNLIDLIEEQDVVVVDGRKYEVGLTDDLETADEVLGIITNIDDNVVDIIPLTNVKVEQVLTHELFEVNCYKVGE